MVVANLPELPLVCLKTADDKNTQEVTRGKNTVIDFWTTKCTRCPDALDKLDSMAQDPKYSDVQFLSICCDKLDGARSLIERDDDLRWQNVSHYFMSHQSKEQAKKVLGFTQVPFYVVLDSEGNITQTGNSRTIDFDELPGVAKPHPTPTKMMEEDNVSSSDTESETESEELSDAPQPRTLFTEESTDNSSAVDDLIDDFDIQIDLDYSNATSSQDKDITAPSPVSVSRVFDMEDLDF